jgi:hypothetical protein
MGVRHGAVRRGLWRSRWAAIGAAVAVTLGGGGLFVANAASSVPSSVVTIDPARILDTRDPVDVGLAGPFVSAVSQKLQVTGSVATSTGTRAVVPAGATGVLLNVTVVAPAAAGFVSIRPGDATGAPSTSSLNFDAGDIVPNAVQVALPTSGADAGKIDITYDAFGVAGPTTDLLFDVVGYMVAVDAGSDAALLAQIAALGAEIEALKASVATTTTNIGTNTTNIATNTAGIAALDGAQPFAVTNRSAFETVESTGEVVVSVTVTAPVAGQVTVNSTTTASEITAGDEVRCSITTSTASIDFDYEQGWESSGMNNGSFSTMAGTRTSNIAGGATATYNLFCRHAGTSGSSFLSDSVLTAIFTPAP